MKSCFSFLVYVLTCELGGTYEAKWLVTLYFCAVF